MNILHPVAFKLIDSLFNDKEADLFVEFSRLLLTRLPSSLEKIWQYDQSLGGLGGYAMPSNPVHNPFNAWGQERNGLFRSVQYAKSGFIYYPHIPRNMIIDTGRSLEFTCKYILDRYSVVSRFRNSGMLGRNLNHMYRKGLLSDKLLEDCRLFASLYNIAKHEMTEERNRTFSTLDGVVAYFSLRKLHNRLLESIGHPRVREIYEIYRGDKR